MFCQGMTTSLRQLANGRIRLNVCGLDSETWARCSTVGSQVVDEAAQLALGHQQADLAQERRRRVERRGRRARAGQRLAGEGA